MRSLLTAARLDQIAGQATPEPAPVLEVIVEQLTNFGEKAADIHVSCSPDLAVFADRSELSTMLANYIDNALTYAVPPIEVEASEREGWVEITVTDHGPGVPDSFVPQVFERFTRGPDSRHLAEGAGVGLWIARNFAHANGGNAWYARSQHGGSAFRLRTAKREGRSEQHAGVGIHHDPCCLSL